MNFLRFLLLVSAVAGVYLAIAQDFWTGLVVFLSVGVLVWVAVTLLDLFGALRNALSRPSVHLYVTPERHPDPTRPDSDVPPVVVLHPDDFNYNGRNGND